MMNPAGSFTSRLSVYLVTVFISFACFGTTTNASDVQVTLPLTEHGMSTYYASVTVHGTAIRAYMVDTGAGYTTINKAMLKELKKKGQVSFNRSITAVMADGSERSVDIYTVRKLTLGENCHFRDVEVAVLPGTSRTILGMSLLKRAAPFTFNAEPPSLSLGQCDDIGERVALGPDVKP
jgi:predicted aspartyl protease